MTYTPYLIANYSTGIDKRLQPWLSPDDAQESLFDGYVYRGVLSKRDGYNYFATGQKGGTPYTESRIVHNIPAEATGQINNGAVLANINLANTQARRGSVTVTDGVESHTDNGLGSFPTASGGSINYLTGVISSFQFNANSGSPVIVDYDYFPGNPVMMVANFYAADNTRELIVADTRYVNRYDPTTNRLEDISPPTAYNGTKRNFFSRVNYPDASDNNRLLFVNNVDVIQSYDGSTVANYVYTGGSITSLTCLQMFQFKDRLVLIRTTENSTVFPRRIRISGAGAQCDDFRTSATGAGFIDIPDDTWIMGAEFNRDDLIIFTQGSSWTLKYTGNDTVPFVLDKIDESRGCQAPFSVFTYLNRTSAASPRGLIITDGYRVERQDESIPDFSFDDVDADFFDLCFSGVVDEDRDHYLLYPPQGQTNPTSRRILTINYDEDNYAIYRLPLSCMGTFVAPYGIIWSDLLIYNNWDEFAQAYSNWNSFPYSKGTPFSIGGGHKGEIWRLNVKESEDNPVKIRNITVINSTIIEVTTDWNNYQSVVTDLTITANDTIFITGVSGMVQLNDKQFPIDSIINNNTFRLNVGNTSLLSPFTTTSIGQAIRVIPFSAIFKKFNPYINSDKKVRCGWLYMYVDSTGTNLTRNIYISNASKADPCVITTTLSHGLTSGDQVNFNNVGGMTELNNNQYFITVLSATTFSLNGVDSSGFTDYTSGGFVTVPDKAKMDIDIITDDRYLPDDTQLNYNTSTPYRGTCTNLSFEDGAKKWYKVYINQTGKFIQFGLRNLQAGAKINVQATMPGFQPVGRII